MRVVNAELTAAIDAAERVVRPTASIDWDGDGHGGVGTIDDISDKLGDLTINRALTGQLPDEVLVVEGISAATASGSLVKGKTDDERLGAVQYWSKLNPGSPLFGKPRASRDARAAVEFLTPSGMQSVPLLTGAVLRGLPVSVHNRRASLSLIDARDRLRAPVALPAFAAEEPYDGTVNSTSSPGLEAGWIVSHALWLCGLPLSPPPRAGCRLWAPMHGSAMPFIGREHVGGLTYAYTEQDVPGAVDYNRVAFDPGPFFLATSFPASFPDPRTNVAGFLADTGTAVWDSSGRSSGRIEIWAKIPNTLPGVNGAFEITVVSPDAGGLGFSDPQAAFRVNPDGTSSLFIQASSSGGVSRTVAGPTYTHDGLWHFYGCHWDDVAGSATFRRDATTSVVAYTAITAGDKPVSTAVSWIGSARVPVAELQITTGITAATAWQPLTWAPGVVVDRPQNRRLAGIYPPENPVQGWTLIQQVYAAERGLVWIGEDGIPQLWTAARLNTADALVPVRTVTSTRDLISLAYRDDRDMIRNIIRVPYTPIAVSQSAAIWTLETLVRIEVGQTWTSTVKLEKPVASAVALSGTGATTATGGAGTFYAISGSGSVRGAATATSPTTVDLVVTNLTAGPIYLADSLGVPDLRLTGQTLTRQTALTVEVRSQTSIDAFDPSPLDVPDNPWSQTRGWALGIAWGLLALLKDEQIVYTDIEIPGDPRLQPLDRLRVVDGQGLVLDTPVTLQQRSDKLAPGSYRSTLVARPSRDQWLLGGVGVGTALGTTILGGTP